MANYLIKEATPLANQENKIRFTIDSKHAEFKTLQQWAQGKDIALKDGQELLTLEKSKGLDALNFFKDKGWVNGRFDAHYMADQIDSLARAREASKAAAAASTSLSA